VNLAELYLLEESIPISEVAWLLSVEEARSFAHACKRWPA
jgi:hypothetical protein